MNKNEKTLVILTPGFAKDETDTACLPLQQQLIIALKENNPQLNIIILSLEYPFQTQKYIWFNTTVIPFNGRGRGLHKLLLRRKLNTTLKKIHKLTPVSGLLSFWYGECAAVGKRFADKYGLKHFCWILGQDAKKENKYPGRIKPRPGELIALSDFLQKEFEKNHGIKPAHLITAGINTKLFNGEKEKDIDILGAGSLIPLKQYDIFLQAVAEIKKQMPGIKAMLIGKGPEKGKLESLITQLGLQSNVTLTGELPYQEVLERMQRTKIFLHPSSYEGFSGVCLEALYAAAHVISFCQAINRKIEQWHIVKTKEELYHRTLTLLQDKQLKSERVLFKSINDTAKDIMTLIK